MKREDSKEREYKCFIPFVTIVILGNLEAVGCERKVEGHMKYVEDKQKKNK